MFSFRDDSTSDERKPLIEKGHEGKNDAAVIEPIEPISPQAVITFDFQKLPPDVARIILSNLFRKELGRLAQVSTAVKAFAENNTFWKYKALRDLPPSGFTTDEIINAIPCDDDIPGIRKKFYRNTLIANNAARSPQPPMQPFMPSLPSEPKDKERELVDGYTLIYGLAGFGMFGCMGALCFPPCIHLAGWSIFSSVGALSYATTAVVTNVSYNNNVRKEKTNYLNQVEDYPQALERYQVNVEKYEKQLIKYNSRMKETFFYPKPETDNDAEPPQQPLMMG